MLRAIKMDGNVSAQVKAFVAEAEAMVEKYGWKDRDVMPWDAPIKVTKILSWLKGYDDCDDGSELIDLANGTAEIMNYWEKYALLPKVTVRVKLNGEIIQTPVELAKELGDLIDWEV